MLPKRTTYVVSVRDTDGPATVEETRTGRKARLSSLKEIGAAYRELMGRHYPAMAVVQVSGLVEDEARLEIEATAVIPENES